MDKLIHLNHMTGDTVTPRHYNALVDVVNAQAKIIETLWKALDTTIAEAEQMSEDLLNLANIVGSLVDDE